MQIPRKSWLIGRSHKKDRRLTAQQKNMIEKTTNKNGRLSQPRALRIVRKIISTGNVMKRRVIMDSSGLGSGCLDGVEYDGRVFSTASFAACKAVDNLDTRIDPAAPGRPDMTTARTANPS